MQPQFPVLIEAGSDRDLSKWFGNNRATIEALLNGPGAVLLRGFDIATELNFAEFVKQFSKDVLQYVNRSTPRTDLGQGIYTATEYPAGLTIPLHNENAFQRDWPLRIIFFCLHPADKGGGQTPLANTLRVTRRIDGEICRKFEEKQIMYIRNYRPDIDIPWQTAFQTESRSEVEQYFIKNGISFEWTGPDALRTRQVCQAFAKHPRTGSVIWFNQAQLQP